LNRNTLFYHRYPWFSRGMSRQLFAFALKRLYFILHITLWIESLMRPGRNRRRASHKGGHQQHTQTQHNLPKPSTIQPNINLSSGLV